MTVLSSIETTARTLASAESSGITASFTTTKTNLSTDTGIYFKTSIYEPLDVANTAELVSRQIVLSVLDNISSNDNLFSVSYTRSVLDSQILQETISEVVAATLPVGYFSGSYVIPEYNKENMGYDLVKVTDSVTTVKT
jgi:hypothetical protein